MTVFVNLGDLVAVAILAAFALLWGLLMVAGYIQVWMRKRNGKQHDNR